MEGCTCMIRRVEGINGRLHLDHGISRTSEIGGSPRSWDE